MNFFFYGTTKKLNVGSQKTGTLTSLKATELKRYRLDFMVFYTKKNVLWSASALCDHKKLTYFWLLVLNIFVQHLVTICPLQSKYKIIPASTWKSRVPTRSLFEKLFLPTGGVKMFHYLSLTCCDRSQRKCLLD